MKNRIKTCLYTLYPIVRYIQKDSSYSLVF